MQITETTFGPKTYLILRKTIPVEQVTDKQMYDDAGKKLGGYMEAHQITPTGPWTVIYFTWDHEKTDMGIAFPVEGVAESHDAELSIIEVPESKAATGTLVGSYDGLKDAHMEMMTYAKEHAFNTDNSALAIEEYLVGPMQDPEQANWKTQIYYLHK